MVTFLYDLVGILVGVGGIFVAYRKHHEDRLRHEVALDRNTEATERLSGTVEKIADKLDTQDKRLDRVEYKLWGV